MENKKRNSPNPLFNVGGLGYTKIFDSVTAGLGATCSVLLGEIVGYCEMSKENVCTVSQDELAFSVGISTSTCKRSLNKLVWEGLIFSKTQISHIPQAYSVNNTVIREFDNNYRKAMVKFLEIEKAIIGKATEEKLVGCVVNTKNGLKILRRYVNIYYDNNLWYAKITKIQNKEYALTEIEVF